MEAQSKKYFIRTIYLYVMCGIACIMITFKTAELFRCVIEMFETPEISLPYELSVTRFGEHNKAYGNLTPEKIEELRQQKIKIYNSEKVNKEIDSKNRKKDRILNKILEILVWLSMFLPHLYVARRYHRKNLNSLDDDK